VDQQPIEELLQPMLPDDIIGESALPAQDFQNLGGSATSSNPALSDEQPAVSPIIEQGRSCIASAAMQQLCTRLHIF
jgi:hypothetical protein